MLYFKTENSKLYNGDCIDIINKHNLKFDKVITSPPYNIIRPNANDRGYDEYKDRLMSNKEYSDWIANLFNLFDKNMNKNGLIMLNLSYGTENTECMNITVSNILEKTNFTLADIIIWKKKNATSNNVSCNKLTRICEFIYVFCRRNEFNTFTTNKKIIGYRKNTKQPIYENVFNYFECNNNNEPCELNKAIFSKEFVYNLIDRYVLKDDIVLDCFSGTGTTMIACEEKQIKFLGCKLSEKQCEYTKNRLSNVQLSLFI